MSGLLENLPTKLTDEQIALDNFNNAFLIFENKSIIVMTQREILKKDQTLHSEGVGNISDLNKAKENLLEYKVEKLALLSKPNTILEQNIIRLIFEASISGLDKEIFEAIKNLKNISPSISLAAANLFLHRAKQTEGAVKMYQDLAEKCAQIAAKKMIKLEALRNEEAAKDPESLTARKITYLEEAFAYYVELRIEILDNLWRMIHHHPQFNLGDIDKCEEIIAEIKHDNPDYISAELVIFEDFTKAILGKERSVDLILALYDRLIQKAIMRDEQDAEEAVNVFWFEELSALYFMKATLELEGVWAESQNLTVDQMMENESIQLFFKVLSEDVGSRYIALFEKYNGQSIQEFHRDHMIYLIKIKKGLLSDEEIFSVEQNKKAFEKKFLVFDDESQGNSTSALGDLLAPTKPDLAMRLFETAFVDTNSRFVEYEIEDFQADPVFDFPTYDKQDFMPRKATS